MGEEIDERGEQYLFEREENAPSQDRPLLSLLRQTAVLAALGVLALASAGFVMGLVGAKTPFVSSEVIWGKLNPLVGQQDSTRQWNELERNP